MRGQIIILCLVIGSSLTVGDAAESTTGEYTFITLAGPPEPGKGAMDGPGGTARFNAPQGAAADSLGNLYVADATNHVIRKIVLANGQVSTLAGLAGSPGFTDGLGGAARFSQPRGVAVDTAGNVFVADAYNHAIRKITPAGEVTTIAGTNVAGCVDGDRNVARFEQPSGVALDAAGNLYVADRSNHRIRLLDPSGTVSTLAGSTNGFADGLGNSAKFNYPHGVAWDSVSNVLCVADRSNNRIRVVTPGGHVSTLAGTGSGALADGPNASAKFKSPSGVAVDAAGNVLVADSGNHALRLIAGGGVSTLAGTNSTGFADGIGIGARFNNPYGVAVAPDGSMYVAESDNQTIRKVNGNQVTTMAGQAVVSGSADGSLSAARFKSPQGLALDSSGNILVVDTANHTIRKITLAGEVSTPWGLAGTAGSTDDPPRFNGPYGITADGAGNFYVADTANHTIREIYASGAVGTFAGLAGSSGTNDGAWTAARFNQPHGVTVDTVSNIIYVADYANFTIRAISSVGQVTTVAGLAGTSGTSDGFGTAARFNYSHGIAADSVHHVMYVADATSHTIRRLGADGVTTVAGQAGSWGALDGVGTAARFKNPSGVVMDAAGNLFITDSTNSIIRKLASSGQVTTVAGLANALGSTSGAGSGARFSGPIGIAVDSASNLYVADTSNHTIRKGFPTCPDWPTVDSATPTVGATVHFSILTNTADNLQWTWVRRPAASAAQLSAANVTNPTFTPDVADVYVFRLTATNAGGAMTIRTVQFTAVPAPTITTQPASQTVNVGQSVSLTVEATGTAPLSYQWQKDGTPLSDGGRITGTASATLNITTVQADDAGNFAVVVTGGEGGTVSSQAATLTVRTPTPPVLAPIADQTVVEGSLLSFTATATDAGAPPEHLTYGLTGAPAGASIDPTNGLFTWVPTVAQGGTNYAFSVTVTDDNNPPASASQMVTITVTHMAVPPPQLTTQPQGQTVRPGAEVLLSVIASGSEPLTYQWQRNGADMAGANQPTLYLGHVQPDHVGEYRVIVSNAGGSVISDAVVVGLTTPIAVRFVLSNAVVQPTGEAVVPVSVTAFTNVSTAQFTLQWDTNLLEFVRVEDFLAGFGPDSQFQEGGEWITDANFGSNRVAEGRLTFAWDDLSGLGTSLPDNAVLFKVRFRVAGSLESGATIAFVDEPTLREVSIDSAPVGFLGQPGNVGKGTPVITWADPSAIAYGTPLGDAQLNATADVPGTFLYEPPAGTVFPAGAPQLLTVTFTPNDPSKFTTATKTVSIAVNAAVPVLSWDNPGDIVYGTPLSSLQLNATASVPGTFVYSPATEAVLPAGGGQTLSVTFTPTDLVNYTVATKTVQLHVSQATPVLAWANPASIVYGTALGSAQLNATADVPGAFDYSPPSGAILNTGTGQILRVAFTPTDTANYSTATKAVTLNVSQANPVLTWANPAEIVYGTALGAAQLNATADVEGSLAYSPASGTILNAGMGQTLGVTFTPTDTANYATVTKTVSLNVSKAVPMLDWADPADIVYGTALGAAQLNATADVPGSLTYAPAAGTALNTGLGQTLSVTFTPADAANYTTASRTVTLNVDKAIPVLTWPTPADITHGTALGDVQLNATANVQGSFVYLPAAGTLLTAGAGQILRVTFTPLDTANYEGVTKTVLLNVNRAAPAVTWANPADITYGTPLGSTQLNATANVPGTFAYVPATGTVLDAGNGQILTASFTPDDTANYTTAAATVSVKVAKALLTVTANNQTRAVGAADPVFTATIVGLQNGDNITAACSSDATVSSPAGNYTITAHLADPDAKLVNYTVVSNPGTLTINAPPSFTANPASQIVAAGGAVTFTVGVSGLAPFSYQWLYHGNPIPGETNGSLTLTGVQGDRAGQYAVTVRDGAAQSVTSAAATLTVMQTISGTVKYHTSNLPVPEVVVSLGGDASQTVTTDASGTYSFTVSAAGAYTVGPDKLTNHPAGSGVTTLDIHIIRRHILNIERLADPHFLLAADANGSGSVSSLDLAHLRRLALGSTSSLPAGLWRFAAADYAFADPTQPWDCPRTRQHSQMTSNQVSQDFVAIKMGDVNTDWTPTLVGLSSLSAHRRSATLMGRAPATLPTVTFRVGSGSGAPGATIKVPVSVAGFSNVTSAQFTLRWNPAVLTFAQVSDFGLAGLAPGNFGTTRIDEGKLSFSWDDPSGTGTSLPDARNIFALQFVALGPDGSSASVSFGDTPTAREVSIHSKLAGVIGQPGQVLTQSPTLTSPVTFQPMLSLGANGAKVFTLSLATTAGKSYVLEATDSLRSPEWHVVVQVTGDGTVMALSDVINLNAQRFYRVRQR